MVIALFALPVAGEAVTTPALTDTNWVLSGLSGSAVEPGPAITLRLEPAGTLGGSDGCNRYGGSYTVDGSAIRISDSLIMTPAACPGPVAQRASRYTQALRQAVSFTIANRQLVLRDASGIELAVFRTDATELAGSVWDVISYNNGKQAVVSVLAGSRITASFGADQRITGSAGCNHYFASYKQSGESITIAAPGATRRACAEPAGVMEQETAFLAALASVATVRQEANRLTLRTPAGAIALFLARQP
jgi:heat shock protein HslJ